MARKDAWVATAILVSTLTSLRPVNAQENHLGETPSQAAETVRPKSPRPAQHSNATTPTSEEGTVPTETNIATVAESTNSELEIADTRRLTLVIGQSKTVTLPAFAKTIQIDNQDVVDAKPNKKNLTQLFITGIRAGVAEVVVTDKNGVGHRINVFITQDASPLQQTLAKLYPDSNIEVIPAGEGSVAVTGNVDNPQAVTPILEIAEKFYPGGVINGIKVVGPQQVQLRVMIAEVSRTKLRALGFNFLQADGNSYFTSTVGGLVTVTGVSGVNPAFTFSPDNNFTFGKIHNGEIFRGFLRALKTEGLAKIVAEPTLVTFSGRAAKMVVGGEFPIIVPGQQGSFSVEFREYGNKLDFVPIVLGGGRIRLEVRPELSQLDYANGVVMQGFTIPGIKQRNLDTSVELNTGETFVIGGLLSTTDTATTSKVPYLGDMAIVGAAFRTVSYSQEEKELVVMVTPELVEPMKAGQKPCGYPGSETAPPSNHELFFLGRVESPACNSCEVARRTELMLDVDHPRSKRPVCGTASGAVAEYKNNAANQPAGTVSIPENETPPSEAQRPTNIPGLLGPLGYDAGR